MLTGQCSCVIFHPWRSFFEIKRENSIVLALKMRDYLLTTGYFANENYSRRKKHARNEEILTCPRRFLRVGQLRFSSYVFGLRLCAYPFSSSFHFWCTFAQVQCDGVELSVKTFTAPTSATVLLIFIFEWYQSISRLCDHQRYSVILCSPILSLLVPSAFSAGFVPSLTFTVHLPARASGWLALWNQWMRWPPDNAPAIFLI